MTPFLEFRVWLRRGPVPERLFAGAAVVLLLALLAWSLVPVDEDGEAQVATSPLADSGEHDAGTGAERGPTDSPEAAEGPRPQGEESSTEPGGEAPSGSESSDAPDTATDGARPSRGGTPSQTTAGGDPCTGLRATDQGVTEEEVFVAVSLLSLGGDVGNETFGVRGDLEEVAHAAAAGINAEGGIACRRLRIKTYRVNPLNASEQRARCLEMVADKPFTVLDFGGYLNSAARSCFPENKLPFQAATPITEREAEASFPYMYSLAPSANRSLRNWVAEAAARGTFQKAKGFEKLGLLMAGCEPEVNDELLRHLDAAGVGNDQLSVFTLSCTPVAPPNQISQAVLQHRQDGATHVFFAASQANASSYVQNAERVRWEPNYLGSDFGLVTSPTTEDSWGSSFDGAVAITSSRTGESNSGITSPRSEPCRAWYTRADVPPPEDEADPAMAMCDFFRLLQAVGNAAGPNLTQDTLLTEALPRVGRFEAATYGDAVFDRRGKVTGGDSIRAIQWHADCACFKVLDRAFEPAAP